MGLSASQIPQFILIAIAFFCQWKLYRWIMKSPGVRQSALLLRTVQIAAIATGLWLAMSFLYLNPELDLYLSSKRWAEWVRGFSLIWGLCVTGFFVVTAALRAAPVYNSGRRRLLKQAATALYAAPALAAGYGVFIARTQFKIREVEIPVTNLPKDLTGLRLVQLSDIHLSPYLSGRELDRIVDMSNETRAHVAVVTGDLITIVDHQLTNCLQRLRRLRAEAGIIGCLGNHEFVARCEQRAKKEGSLLGLDFLRGESRQLRFGKANLNIAGVDHQHRSQTYLEGAEALLHPGEINILLSHNPDVFPVAADLGFNVTLAGHTHGGQITAGVLGQHLNAARFLTPYVYGLYRKGSSSAYVTSGIGTVSIPARMGAPPEIALLRLCAT